MKPLTTGELAKRTGTTRKALRIYEGAGLLKPTSRTAAGYRMYGAEAVDLVRFIVKARSIGFSVSDIRTVVGIRRSGGAPCSHVRELIRRKLAEVEQSLTALKEARQGLSSLLRSWQRMPPIRAAVCGHIERLTLRRGGDSNESDAMHRVRKLPGGRAHANGREDR
jgi:DNA-binding transcriptional MerR regulator